MKYKVLSIAGFDNSGGAGLQADLKTISALGCYAMTIVTAIAVQNTIGVKNCYNIQLECIEEQLDSIFEDLKPDVIKIGMLFNSDIIILISNYLKNNAKDIPIILDPVMCAKSGDHLLLPEAIQTLKTELIPIVTIITPNLPEAETISGYKIKNKKDMEKVAQGILALGTRSIFLKGGHLYDEESADLFIDNQGNKEWFSHKRIKTVNDHGTGCTLSAAIASYVALGNDLKTSCKLAKEYLTNALYAAKDIKIGHGHGPVHHFYKLNSTTDKE